MISGPVVIDASVVVEYLVDPSRPRNAALVQEAWDLRGAVTI